MRFPTATLLLLTAIACQPAPPEPQPEPEALRVENADLDIALAQLADGFVVRTNEGDTLELERAAKLAVGEAWFEIGPNETAGVNLVDHVNGQRERYESLPAGTFSGSRELLMADGRPAYYSRGQYEHEGKQVEEFRISALHPSQNRLLLVYYRYPAADDSSDRLHDLLLLIGEIEARTTTSPDSQ